MKFFLSTGIIFFSLSAFSLMKETYKEIIQKAHSLSLQQDRLQAIQILTRALGVETSSRATTELQKTLDEVSTLFYTEKGQSAYEYGRSLLRSAPNEALEKLSAALILEPHNVSVLIQQARTQLLLGKCDETESIAAEIIKIHPFRKDVYLLQGQAKACLQKTEEALDALKKTDETVYSFTAHAQLSFQKKEYAQAAAYISLAKMADSQFPEIYFWDMQIRKKTNDKFETQILKYTKICKTLTNKEYFKYEREPRLCQEYKNLETEFKNIIETENKKEL